MMAAVLVRSMTQKRNFDVIKKQNLRINVLAAAVLSMTAVGAVHAAGLPTREPVRQASTAEPGAERIIVKYRAGTAAAGDRSVAVHRAVRADPRQPVRWHRPRQHAGPAGRAQARRRCRPDPPAGARRLRNCSAC